VQRSAERLERRTYGGEPVVGGADEDPQRAVLRLRDAAENRRVDDADRGRHALREVVNRRRADRRHLDERRPRLHRGKRRVRHLAERRRVAQHRHRKLASAHGVGGIVGDACARGSEWLRAAPRPVPHGDVVACNDKPPRHRRPHRAQAEEGDRLRHERNLDSK
jgi:hypothetical protein